MKTKIKKMLFFPIAFAVSFFILVNNSVMAADGKLTNEKALQTVLQVLHCSGQCKMNVIGIQEIPQENSARADIKISNITFERPKNDAVTAYAFGPGGGSYIWSGNAIAVFGHYNDGTWVLRQIVTEVGNWNDLNIVVGSKQQNEGTQRLEKEKVEAETLSAEEVPMKKVKKVKKAKILANETRRDGRFIAYDDGTVLDTQTNLMWAAKDNGSDINWKDAKSYCENYRGGGFTDWRMPTTDELMWLYDPSKRKPASCRTSMSLNVVTELIDISCNCLWSSETRGPDANRFNFVGGTTLWFTQSKDRFERALPVRSGK
jgi:hypothetical protein